MSSQGQPDSSPKGVRERSAFPTVHRWGQALVILIVEVLVFGHISWSDTPLYMNTPGAGLWVLLNFFGALVGLTLAGYALLRSPTGGGGCALLVETYLGTAVAVIAAYWVPGRLTWSSLWLYMFAVQLGGLFLAACVEAWRQAALQRRRRASRTGAQE